MIYSLEDIKPEFAEGVFIAPSADIIGDVKIKKDSSIWFGCVIRGDVNYIRIGECCNIQDMSMIHVTNGKFPTILGDHVSLGHRVTLHGCILYDYSFIGMGATVMDGCEIGEFAFLAAGSLLTPGKKIPPGMMAMGSPAKVIREITAEEKALILRTSENYKNYKNRYLQDSFKPV